MTLTDVINYRYRLLDHLGDGGMGSVFRAHDALTDQIVALKRLHFAGDAQQTPSNDREAMRVSLAREFHALAALRHPNVIGVVDYGFDTHHQPYFTMDLLEKAAPFTRALKDRPPADQVRLIVDMLWALAYVHRCGIVHRDLKPANVLVDGGGTVKVLDFGLARLTLPEFSTLSRDGMVGTLAYMPPEAFRGDVLTASADLYAVGVMLYELYAGAHPFNKKTVAALITETLEKTADTSMIAPPLAAVIDRLLAKTPEERYPDAEAVIPALVAAFGLPIAVEREAVRESFLRASAFVGRDAELEGLRDALRAARDGNGSTWLIGGESGVGKTRLIDELQTRALVKGALVLRGQAAAGESLPFQLWRDLARRLAITTALTDLEAGTLKALVPDIAALIGRPVEDAPRLEGNPAKQRLHQTLTALLRRQTAPLAILLEDLQWAGESLELLESLAAAAGDMPWLIVGSYRDDEAPELPERFPTARTIRLARLTPDSIAELSAAMLGEAGRNPEVIALLQAETEGNTYFMVETVRALAEEAGSLSAVGQKTLPTGLITGGMRRVLERRIARVPAWGQDALRLAAVIGRRIDFAVMDALGLTIDGEAWLTACANAAVLERGDLGWQFAHDKLREMIRAALPDDARPSLHERAARALEQVYGGDPAYAERVSDHWRQAGQMRAAAETAVIAGEYLILAAASYARALRLLENTLAAIPADDGRYQGAAWGEYRADLRRLIGDCLRRLGRTHDALPVLEAALTEAAAPLLRGRIVNGIALVYWRLGNYPQARAMAETALALSETADNDRMIGNALNTLGLVAMNQGVLPLAREYFTRSLAIRERIQDRVGISGSLNNLGLVAHNQGDYPAALDYFTASQEMDIALGDRQGRSYSLNNLAMVASAMGDYPTALERYETCMAIQREIGDLTGVAICLNNLGAVAGLMGDTPTAQRYYQESLVIRRKVGDRAGEAFSLNNLGTAAYDLGDYPMAAAYQRESLDVRRAIDDRHGVIVSLGDLALPLVMMGQMAEARAALAEAFAAAAALDNQAATVKLVARAAHYLAHAGDPTYAAVLAGLVEAHPAAESELRDVDVPRLRWLVSGMIDPEATNAAVEQGRTANLDSTAAALRERFVVG